MIAIIAVVNMHCNTKDKQAANDFSKVYLNHSDTVKYLGINTCKQCHSNIYETFIQTGMGKSFDVATHQKSSAVFGKNAVVYDKFRNFYYKSFCIILLTQHNFHLIQQIILLLRLRLNFLVFLMLKKFSKRFKILFSKIYSNLMKTE